MNWRFWKRTTPHMPSTLHVPIYKQDELRDLVYTLARAGYEPLAIRPNIDSHSESFRHLPDHMLLPNLPMPQARGWTVEFRLVGYCGLTRDWVEKLEPSDPSSPAGLKALPLRSIFNP